MNDPWHVKCVRQAGQYVSCMRINGVPLLPPVLSTECRTEMQYYKLLAKEVEKRICLLQPYVMQTDSESEDKTDAPELPECELIYELPHEEVQDGFNVNIDKITAINSAKNSEKSVASPRHAPINDICNNITSNVVMDSGSRSSSPKFIIDVSLSIHEAGKEQLEPIKKSPSLEPIKRSPSYPQTDLPERDYNCTRRITQQVITEKEVITAVETQRSKSNRTLIEEVTNFGFNPNKNKITDSFADIILSQDGPSSISSKSFTGSLNDLHSDSNKELLNSKLIRQSSYTLLNPSPELLAHLEVQSLNTGIEVNAISMSESVSNLSSPNKKRRSWDLETAKVKWSSMALELKQTDVINSLNRNASNKNIYLRSPSKKTPKVTPLLRSKTVVAEKTKRSIVTPKTMTKSNLISNSGRLPKSEPVAKTGRSVSPKSHKKPEPLTPSDAPPSKSESEDPAARVRGLYEKIKNQQLLQMTSLMEKQKKEQQLLQQVFEEQNNLLFKQLKTICPKSPIEVKEAWCDKHLKGDRGPVSLSQLINYKSPEQSGFDGPVSSTLVETNNYINQCDNVLKKSRDITGSIKKQPVKTRSQNATKIVSPRTEPEGSRTRTHSPVSRNVPPSRRLNYDTSASSDRDNDPMLTDRTNDTMADLNVTFPSDNTEDFNTYDHLTSSIVGHLLDKDMNTIHGPTHTSSTTYSRSTDNSIRDMEKTIHNSINNTNLRTSNPKFKIQPTGPAERAAATKIVAVAKGYLVRRLMKTDRVQATVQTIKDALLCALQLHQDREGIRGADVDLHRRLIQQITAACYSLHDTFIASTASERCTIIAADRGRRRSLAARQANNSFKQTDLMSQSHVGAFPARTKRPPAALLMTQSNYETFNGDNRPGMSVSRQIVSPRRRPWR